MTTATFHAQESLFSTIDVSRFLRHGWISASNVNDVINLVTWRSRFRDQVFAETGARQIESWVALYEGYETYLIRRRNYRAVDECRADLYRKVNMLERLLRGDCATRPSRRMPPMKRIAEHHQLPTPPACVRCGWETPVKNWREAQSHLERAHIIDRVCDGLDVVANLAPLCPRCHRRQPMFDAGDEAEALDWFGLPPLPATRMTRTHRGQPANNCAPCRADRLAGAA